jgi:uncharacterized membrane protein
MSLLAMNIIGVIIIVAVVLGTTAIIFAVRDRRYNKGVAANVARRQARSY